MRTTLDLPEELIDEAMRLTNNETITAVVICALENLVRKAKIEEIKAYKGQVELSIDLDSLRERP